MTLHRGDPNTRSKARKLDRRQRQAQEAYRGVTEPSSDELQTAASYEQGFGNAGRTLLGRIVFASPYTHWYRVSMEALRGEMMCCAAMETSDSPFSITNSSPITPGTPVIVFCPTGLPWGVIMGCLPTPTTGGSFSDYISQGSHVGFRQEGYYKDFASMFTKDGGQIDFSNSRPVDSLSIGEWGRFSQLGGGLFIDPLMQFMRIDERCGMWMYYMDKLLRLAAHNYDFISSGSETNIRNDSGEILDYQGSTPYAWEALGALTHGATVHTITADEEVAYGGAKAKIEPYSADQQAFYRLEEYRGYLGQAFMRQVVVPPPGVERQQYSGNSGIGVFREQISLDGGWAVASAHSLSLSKRLIIPIPKRLRTPEDPEGDDIGDEENPGEYKFAGVVGEGDEHVVKGGLTVDVTDGRLNAAALSDWAAYVYNWKGLHPFHYHEKDFSIPSGSELEPFTRLQAPIDFSRLSSGQRLEPPEPIQLKVDHRYNEVDYFETSACYTILPDGSVVIRDGYGSQIMMTGGDIDISAPGNITLRSGRSVVTMAGQDAILKARKSVDISATENDVRLKAEHNMDLLAGNNDNTGRLLLDCQSSGDVNHVSGVEGEEVSQNGLILKAHKSTVAVLAGNVFMKTNQDYMSGEIIIDANAGKSGISMIGREVDVHCENGFNVAMGVKTKSSVYRFGKFVCHIPGSLLAGSGIIVQKEGITCNGNISGINCIIGSDGNANKPFNGSLGQFKPGTPSYDSLRNTVQLATEFLADSRKTYNTAYKDLQERWYAEDRIGNPEVIRDTSYSPRNDEQLGVEDYTIAEAYWQQLARLTSQATTGWEEKPIIYQGVPMMPYPGKKAWTEDEAFLQSDLTLYDPQTGNDVARDEETYQNAQIGPWSRTTLDGNYPVL